MNTVSDLTTNVHTGDLRIDSLLDSVSPWNFLLPYRNTLYYTFDAGNGSYIDDQTNSPIVAFNESQQSAARSILGYVSGLIGVNFVEVPSSSDADFHFASTDINGSSTAGLTGISYGYSHSNGNLISLSADATILLDNVEFAVANDTPTAGGDGYETLLHEIGHALGLGHPFNTPNKLPANQDNTNNTVMSYTETGVSKSTFQQYDRWALTWIYGGDGLGGSWGYNSLNGFSLDPGAQDITPPTVLSFLPADGSTDVEINPQIDITFSESIARGAGNITLKTAAGVVVEVYDAATSGSLNFNGDTLILTPSLPLAEGTEYRLELPAGTVLDLAGNPYAGANNYNFTTQLPEDTTAPVIESLSPVDGAQNVSIGTDLKLTFDEAISLGSGTIILKTESGTTVASWNVASNKDLLLAVDTLTLTLDSNLDYNTHYYLTLPMGVVKDLAGNSFTGSSQYDFITRESPDTSPPEIVRFSPSDGTVNVVLDTDITLTFNEVIRLGTGTIVLRTDTGASVSSWNVTSGQNLAISGNKLVLNLNHNLDYDTHYVLHLPSGYIEDSAGNGVPGSSNYDFRTLAEPDVTAPAIIQFTPAEDSLDISVNTTIQIKFDEAISAGEGDIILQTESGTVIEIFDITGNAGLEISENTLTLYPSSPLDFGTDFVLLFDAGTIQDLSGNPIAAISHYGFSTEPAIVNAQPVGTLLLYGDAIAGNTLLAETRAITDDDGLGEFQYQWYKNNEVIQGENSTTYVLNDNDVGALLNVELSYIDGAGNNEYIAGESRLVTDASSLSYTDLIQMYVIILGRAPAQSGLDFWSGIVNDGKDFEYVASEMWNSAGAREFYPDSMSTEEVVTSVYTNILVRSPKEEGLNYWVGQWEKNGPVDTMLEMIRALTANNSTDPQAILDKTLFQAKVDVGGYLANTVGNSDIVLARAAFDYLESGLSVQDTKQYIDNQMSQIGQADIAVTDDLFS